jgi:hypothetical protein
MQKIIEQSLNAFSNYPENSRVWVYQADRILNDGEVDTIEIALKNFVPTWTAHGKHLDASFAILFNTFIVLIVNESLEKASGCSIDSSVKVIKELGQELNINFFDRFAITYIQGEEFNCVTKEQFQALVNANTENLWVFNNTITSLKALKQNWLIPFKYSWQEQYFAEVNTFSLKL